MKEAFIEASRRLHHVPNINCNNGHVNNVQGDLGLRLEEKLLNGGVTSSVVTNITDKSQAAIKRVQLDSYVVGVNGESYISHAHTIA